MARRALRWMYENLTGGVPVLSAVGVPTACALLFATVKSVELVGTE